MLTLSSRNISATKKKEQLRNDYDIIPWYNTSKKSKQWTALFTDQSKVHSYLSFLRGRGGWGVHVRQINLTPSSAWKSV